MNRKPIKKRKFYGTTTLGEKGQVVIPAQARETLKLKKGEKLLVFGFDNDMVAFSKLSHMEEFAHHLEEGLRDIKLIIKKQNK